MNAQARRATSGCPTSFRRNEDDPVMIHVKYSGDAALTAAPKTDCPNGRAIGLVRWSVHRPPCRSSVGGRAAREGKNIFTMLETGVGQCPPVYPGGKVTGLRSWQLQPSRSAGRALVRCPQSQAASLSSGLGCIPWTGTATNVCGGLHQLSMPSAPTKQEKFRDRRQAVGGRS